jgi:hypothetical protein
LSGAKHTRFAKVLTFAWDSPPSPFLSY